MICYNCKKKYKCEKSKIKNNNICKKCYEYLIFKCKYCKNITLYNKHNKKCEYCLEILCNYCFKCVNI
jgi:hypothetical protein